MARDTAEQRGEQRAHALAERERNPAGKRGDQGGRKAGPSSGAREARPRMRADVMLRD